MGSIPTREIELLFFNIFIPSLWYQGKISALSSPTQHAMLRNIRRKAGNGVTYNYVPFAYPAGCGIQREADLINILYTMHKIMCTFI